MDKFTYDVTVRVIVDKQIVGSGLESNVADYIESKVRRDLPDGVNAYVIAVTSRS